MAANQAASGAIFSIRFLGLHADCSGCEPMLRMQPRAGIVYVTESRRPLSFSLRPYVSHMAGTAPIL
jgi:hypothetical protein